MDSASKKTVRLPTFNGSSKDYQVWWAQFTAYAAVNKFVEALTIGGEAVLLTREADVPDLTTTVGKEQAAAVKRNAIAMANLTMAFTSEATMGLLFKAKTTEWPSGWAHLVVSGLNKKYNPQDTISRVELRQRLSAIRMKKNKDPTTLFEQIISIENKFNTSTRHIEEEDLIVVILDAAPQEYQSLLTTEQRIKGASITLSNLEVVMGQFWCQTKSAREKSGNSGDDLEFSLATFDGKCFRCGKYGHMGKNCPEDSKNMIKDSKNTNNKSNNHKKRFNGKCFICGKEGHIAKDCSEKQENADKRPKGWK
jgi:hypothetical protein